MLTDKDKEILAIAIQQAKDGQVTYLGDFSQYIEELEMNISYSHEMIELCEIIKELEIVKDILLDNYGMSDIHITEVINKSYQELGKTTLKHLNSQSRQGE